MNDYTAGKTWKIERRQKIMETGFRLFAEKGIEMVMLSTIAKESGVGNATLYRYFNTKLDLAIEISTWTWDMYIQSRHASVSNEALQQMTGAEYLRLFLDSFIDLYRNHRDLLRFNYNLNSFLKHEAGTEEQRQPFIRLADQFGTLFHVFYERGISDGTLNKKYTETTMFSSSFHIMLASVTRYAVGLLYIPDEGGDPEKELLLLEEMFLDRFTVSVQDVP